MVNLVDLLRTYETYETHFTPSWSCSLFETQPSHFVQFEDAGFSLDEMT